MKDQKLLLVSMTLGAGGAERNIIHLANWFQEDYQTAILTLSNIESDHFVIPERVARLVGKLSSHQLPKITPRFLKIIINVFYLRSKVKDYDPDICICFVDEMNLLLLLALLGTGIPVIVSERTHPAHHKINRILKLLRPLVYRLAVKLVVQTDSISTWCKTHWMLTATSISVIPNPVHQASPKEYHSQPKAYCIGRMDLHKNHTLLLDIFSLQDAPRIETFLIGDGSLKSYLKERIHLERLPIKILDPVLDISELLYPGDILIHCSLYEGFPNVVLEAMSCGVIPVCTPFPGVEYIIKHGESGLIATDFLAETLKELVNSILHNQSLRETLSHNAILSAVNYCPEKVMPQWSELVKSHCKKQGTT